MSMRLLVPLALVIMQVASTAASAQQPRPPQSVESAQAQARTVQEMRNVGTALFPLAVPAEEKGMPHSPSINRRSPRGMRAKGLCRDIPRFLPFIPLGNGPVPILLMPFPTLLDRGGGGMLLEEEGMLC
jgi:hypothetical protein